ncbi:MAG: glycogen synthase [Parcubacteria group bacterium]|nr:glycogen synthase [Parcubacteria group bacterium]
MPFKEPLTIWHIAAEFAPYSKTGGLAEVARALPEWLFKMGHKVAVITPLYGAFDPKELKLTRVFSDITVSLSPSYSYTFSVQRAEVLPGFFVYAIEHYQFFGNRKNLYQYEDDALRFFFFDQAAIAVMEALGEPIDIVHAHDWHAGLVPYFIRTTEHEHPVFARTATIFTVHNMLYQGQGTLNERYLSKAERDDGIAPLPSPAHVHLLALINFVKRGILHADAINTVSERHARELLTPEFGQGLEKELRKRRGDFHGIVNGIDYHEYNPLFDPGVFLNYDADSLDRKTVNKELLQKELGLTMKSGSPLIGISNRLTEQKGFDLIRDIAEDLIDQGLQIVMVGNGAEEYLTFFRELSKKYPKDVALVTPYSEEMSRKIFAASDLYLMPSRFEPCGISQMISLRYGSIPIVRATGGLTDTISNFSPAHPSGNGFVFHTHSPRALLGAITRALEVYRHRNEWVHLVWRAMHQSFSWEIPAKRYLLMYRQTLRKKFGQPRPK